MAERLHCVPDAQHDSPKLPQPWQMLELEHSRPDWHSFTSQQCAPREPQRGLHFEDVGSQNNPGALPHHCRGQQSPPGILPQLLLQRPVAVSQTRPRLQWLSGWQQSSPTAVPQNEYEPWEPDAMQLTSAP